jgi:hypothetical protein
VAKQRRSACAVRAEHRNANGAAHRDSRKRAICGNRCKVEPGVYNVTASIIGIPFVDIEGSGENVTTLNVTVDGAWVRILNNEEIRCLTITRSVSSTFVVLSLGAGGGTASARFVTVSDYTSNPRTVSTSGGSAVLDHVSVSSSGIAVESGVPLTLKDCYVYGGGSGLIVWSASTTIVNTEITGYYEALRVYGSGSSTRVTGSTLRSTFPAGHYAVSADSGTVFVTNSTLDGLTYHSKCFNVSDPNLNSVTCY